MLLGADHDVTPQTLSLDAGLSGASATYRVGVSPR